MSHLSACKRSNVLQSVSKAPKTEKNSTVIQISSVLIQWLLLLEKDLCVSLLFVCCLVTEVITLIYFGLIYDSPARNVFLLIPFMKFNFNQKKMPNSHLLLFLNYFLI